MEVGETVKVHLVLVPYFRWIYKALTVCVVNLLLVKPIRVMILPSVP